MSKVMEYVKWFFNDIATVPRLAVALSIAFAAVVLILFVSNFAFGAMAKVRSANAKTKRFFKKNDNIDYYNLKAFYKKCIAILPQKARKSWKYFEISGKPIQNTQFELILRESVAKGGAIGFGIYLYLYIGVMAALVVAMMLSNMPQEVSSIYVCICLIVGAVGLFILGMQLYIMDKKASLRLDSMVCMIYTKSQIYRERPKKAETREISPCMIADIHSNEARVQLPTFSNLDRINQAMNLEARAISNTANQNAVQEVSVASLQTAEQEDYIGKLNTLVESIVKQGGSAELLDSVRGALLAVYDSKFSKPLDEIRVKCIIKKLEAVS